MTAWSTTDKSANITLSGSNLVATTSSATQGAVRADTTFASGKYYFECVYGTASGSNFGVGWANSTASLSSYIGVDKNGVASFITNTNAAVYFNAGVVGNLGRTGIAGMTLCVAFDITNKLIWFRWGGGPWNGSGTVDPVS